MILLPGSRRAWNLRTVLVGTAYASTLVTYILANKLTTAASTIFLQGTAPLYVVLLGPWLLKEAIRWRDLAFLIAIAGGMALFFVGTQPVSGTAPDPIRGNMVAVATGLCWGLTIMGIRWLGRDDRASPGGSARAVACGNVIAFALCLPLAHPASGATPADWLVVTYLGVVQVAIAYVLLTRGMTRVLALEASLLLLVEPVLNPVWAWLLHGERPGLWAVLGGALILAATTTRAVSERTAPES
jgi:drug/metabolite transporter (DMT)-like permease